MKNMDHWPPKDGEREELTEAIHGNAIAFLTDVADAMEKHFGRVLPFVLLTTSVEEHHRLGNLDHGPMRAHLLRDALIDELNHVVHAGDDDEH